MQGRLLHRSAPPLGRIRPLALDLNFAADGRQGSGE